MARVSKRVTENALESENGREQQANDFDGELVRVDALLAAKRWRVDPNPEFTKNLRYFRMLISGASRIEARKMSILYDKEKERVHAAIKLPTTTPTLEALMGRRFALELLLVEVGDCEYLRWRAAGLCDEGDSTIVNWRKMFDGKLPPLLEMASEDASDGKAATDTRRMLSRILAAKEAADLPLRARRSFKHQALYRVVLPALVATTVALFVLLLIRAGDDLDFLLVPSAGAAGAALGGLLKLRDELSHGTQIRDFSAFFVGQVVIGVLAGLVVFLVDDAGIVNLSDAATGVAALAFATGFSEAAFIGLISRVGRPAAKE